jgi:3-oxoacyl-[acyl-carrier protein] reductase
MELNLKDKVVLVTGSSQGIGKSIAASFLIEGAKVVINGRNKNKLENTYTQLLENTSSDKLLKYKGDLTEPLNIKECLQETIQHWKKIDILITNIGSGKPNSENDPIKEIERMDKINYQSAVDIIAETIPLMQNNAGANIICISSIAGVENIGAPVAYEKAKSKLLAFCSEKSIELAKQGIRINAISPGNIFFKNGRWEELQNNDPDKIADIISKFVPMNRFGIPQEIANAALFLASARSSFTTGSNFIVDGGQIAKKRSNT